MCRDSRQVLSFVSCSEAQDIPDERGARRNEDLHSGQQGKPNERTFWFPLGRFLNRDAGSRLTTIYLPLGELPTVTRPKFGSGKT
jgi:hypothetical protein